MQNMYGGENYLHAHIHETKDWQEYVFKCSGCRCGGLWYRKNGEVGGGGGGGNFF